LLIFIPPRYELRLGILQSKAERMKPECAAQGAGVCRPQDYLQCARAGRCLNRIIAHAELVGRPICLETAQEVLQDLLRAHDRRITIDEIQRQVAAHFNIRLADMASARRSRSIARPRQIAMYLAKQLTPRSLPEIGRKFGGRDHTTVMHAVKVIEQMKGADAAFAEDVDLLRRMLEG
jgi:chromosomal replication initiator protein